MMELMHHEVDHQDGLTETKNTNKTSHT